MSNIIRFPTKLTRHMIDLPLESGIHRRHIHIDEMLKGMPPYVLETFRKYSFPKLRLVKLED